MPATAIVTKLGAREVSKSREYISGLVQALPEKHQTYKSLVAMAEVQKDDKAKKIILSGANGVFLEFESQKAELRARLSEVLDEISKDADAFAKFLSPFLPYFQTQQEMVAAKNAK